MSFLLFLRIVWMGAVGFVALGLLVLGVLIVLRFLQERRLRRTLAMRRDAHRTLLGWVNGGAAEADLKPLARMQKRDLCDLFDEFDQMLRGEAQARLAEAGRALDLERHLLFRLRWGPAAVRVDAARRLALFEGPKTAAALEAALGDGNVRVRLAAAVALVAKAADAGALARRVLADGRAAIPSARDFLLALARKDGALAATLLDEVPEAWCPPLIGALAEAGEPGAVAPLARFARPGNPAPVRVAGLQGLLRLRSRQAWPLAEAAQDDPDEAVRHAARAVLAARPAARRDDRKPAPTTNEPALEALAR
ncbi:MAG: hypothetical protein KDG89_09780 [Geminicoccaceae bacterium]|nr:hypothetical protein [Geminicoccaceae bacterium]